MSEEDSALYSENAYYDQVTLTSRAFNAFAYDSNYTTDTLARLAKDSAVKLVCTVATDNSSWSGSGFFVKPNYIATAAHVIAGVDSCTVEDNNHRIMSVVGIADLQANHDFVVLKVDGTGIPVTFADSEDTFKDAALMVIGSTNTKFNNDMRGRVIKRVRYLNGTKAFETTVKSEPGNSGGMVINDRGEVIATVVSSTHGADGKTLVSYYHFSDHLSKSVSGLTEESELTFFDPDRTTSISRIEEMSPIEIRYTGAADMDEMDKVFALADAIKKWMVQDPKESEKYFYNTGISGDNLTEIELLVGMHFSDYARALGGETSVIERLQYTTATEFIPTLLETLPENPSKYQRYYSSSSYLDTIVLRAYRVGKTGYKAIVNTRIRVTTIDEETYVPTEKKTPYETKLVDILDGPDGFRITGITDIK
ncbi:S1 family peptidase [Paenibacillus periandrae]|uniref:S1 family peptidase n=1 Tax=Paenibacillus periandrae TaxID=1761741 RepID=UPI001F096458|nr:serine protease [Paenibacillus periandrae]